jgi:ABC-2 type transport system permease protein
MAKLWAVIRREYLERVRSRWFLIATVFGPVLFGALLFLPAILTARDRARGPEDLSRIVILDATASALGERVASALGGGLSGGASQARLERVQSATLAEAEERATTLVLADSVRGYLVLDSATLAGRTARYAGTNTTAMLEMSALERSVQRQVQLMRMEAAGLDASTSDQLTGVNVTIATERLSERGRSDGNAFAGVLFGIGVAMLLYMTIFIYGLNVMRGVLEEKQSRVAEVVLASISPSRLLIGKVIGVGSVGLTQIMIWVGVGWLMYSVRERVLSSFDAGGLPFAMPDIGVAGAVIILLFFVFGFLFYAGLFAAVGATVNSEQEAQQAQMPVVLLLLLSVMFLQNILMQPDGTIAVLLSVLPFSAPIVMPMRMSMTDVPATHLAGALASVITGAVLATWLAARIYRVGLLMYGKRPTVRELARWVRRR